MIKKLKILGHNYEVILDPKLDFDSRKVGECHTGDNWIKICSIYKRSRQEEALIHEIIEAINYHLELELEHPKISSLSEALYQVLKDNKLLKI